MKRQIEIFTAGCPLCDPVVKMVKEIACDKCEITVYDLVKQCDHKICLTKMKEYDIKKVPAVAVNGELLSCCKNEGVTREELIEAGIGQA